VVGNAVGLGGPERTKRADLADKQTRRGT
jgi:hypothetical protein